MEKNLDMSAGAVIFFESIKRGVRRALHCYLPAGGIDWRPGATRAAIGFLGILEKPGNG
jgi:hypothetical protein